MCSSKVTVPDSVVKATRAVLLSSVKGVTLRNFAKDYVNLLGERFPWKKLGYSCAKELLAAMPDTVRFEYSEKDVDYRLYGIGTKDMFMPSWVVKAQGKINKPSASVQTSPQSVGKGRGARELVYNASGLVTVRISWVILNHKHKEIREMKELLTDLMSSVAEPVEVFVHRDCLAFGRFSVLSEAKQVMQKMNDLKINGLLFKAQPARERMPRGKVKPAVKVSSLRTVRKNSNRNVVFPEARGKISEGITPSRNLSSHACHVTAVGPRTALHCSEPRVKSCDIGENGTTGLCDQSCGCSQNGYSESRYLDTLGFSDSESDSSDVDWDYDLLECPNRNNIRAGCQLIGESCGESDLTLSGMQVANERGLTPVRIAEVVSPDQIWIQFAVAPEPDLESISTAVSASEPDPLSKQELTAGLLCAVLTCEGREGREDVYRRARVMEVATPLFAKQPQASLELVDVGSVMPSVALQSLYKLPRCVSMGVAPPLSIPTAIEGLHSTFNYGDDWFPLDKQLLWEHLRHKTVFAKVVKKPAGKQVGVVDLYFDPAGQESVCDLLIEKGLFLSSERPAVKTPPPVTQLPSPTPSQTNSKMSLLASLVKKSMAEKCLTQQEHKQSRNSMSSDHREKSLCNGDESTVTKEGGTVAKEEGAGGTGYCEMPPLECCSISEDDWWSESDYCTDSRRLSSKDHVTSGYSSTTDHVTHDW